MEGDMVREGGKRKLGEDGKDACSLISDGGVKRRSKRRRKEVGVDITAKHGDLMSTLSDLPQDRIVSFLGIRDKVQAAQICSSWRNIVYRPCQWREAKVMLGLKKLSEKDLTSYRERKIRNVIAHTIQPMSKAVSVIHDWPNLVSLDISLDRCSSQKVAFQVLQKPFWKNFVSLRKLVIDVGDEGLHEFHGIFQQISNLEDLRLTAKKCGGVVEPINRHLKCLKHLALKSDGDTLSLESLDQLSTLQSLELGVFEVLRFDLLKSSCEGLKKLIFRDCQFDLQGWLEVLSQILSLEELELTYCAPEPEDGLEQLSKGLKNLKVFSYAMCRNLCDDDFRHIGQMSKLQELQLGRCRLEGDGLGALSCGCKDLRSLSINGLQGISCEAMKCIAGMSSLQDLMLCYSDGCSLKILSEGSCQLKKLCVVGCSEVKGEDMKYVAQMSSLRELTLKGMPLGSTGISCLNQGTFKLEALTIENCDFTFLGLKPLLEKQVSLQRVILRFCQKKNDYKTKVVSLKKRLPFLTKWEVTVF